MASESPKRSLLLRALGCLGVMTLLLSCVICGTGYWFYSNWTTMPEWWEQNQQAMGQMDTAELDEMAESVEKRLFNEVGSEQEAEPTPRTITISMDEASAWMRQRLPKWLANTGQTLPPEYEDFMLASDEDLLVLAFYHTEAKQVFSILMDVQINENDMLEIKLEEVRGGSVVLPVETFVAMLEQQQTDAPAGSSDDARKLMDGIEMSPVFQLPGDSNRLMRIKAIDLQPDAIELTVEPTQTLTPSENQASPATPSE